MATDQALSINYANVDGEGVAPGRIVYLKPTICETEPYDIYNYARSSQDFPHESTGDQWFSESQFESYRALGKAATLSILGDKTGAAAGLKGFAAEISAYLSPRPGVRAVA